MEFEGVLKGVLEQVWVSKKALEQVWALKEVLEQILIEDYHKAKRSI